MSKKIIIPILFFLSVSIFGQADPYEKLLAEIDSENNSEKPSFLGTRVGNGPSTEIMGQGELQMMINHRFGLLKGGFYEFFGLDQADIRIGFDYGITDKITFGIGRSSYQKTYDFSLKAKIINQKKDKLPFSLTAYLAAYQNTLQNIFPEEKDNFIDRQSYHPQILISHRIKDRAAIMYTTGVLYENYSLVFMETKSHFLNGFGGRIKISKRMHITGEYFLVTNKSENSYDPFSLGLELDTGGHLFQLIFSNSHTPSTKAVLTDTFSQWQKGEIYFGFNLIRIFYLTSKKI